MKLGCLVAFNHLTSPQLIADIARAVEARGFDSLWVPEHVLFFPQYASRYPYSDDGRLAGDPIGVMEPFTALTYVAALTQRIRLGTGICLVPQRAPVYTAKQVADLDFLSGGRVDFGVGIGWLKEEFDALDVPFNERAPRIEECLAMMRTLWCDEVSSYTGKYYTLPPSYQNPKPVQKPHPPIFFGGESDAALSRVARIGQGWYGFRLTPETLRERLVVLDRMLAAQHRSRSDIQLYVSPFGGAVNADDFARFRDQGVEQIMLPVGGRTLDKFLERADALLALRPH